MLGFTPTLDQSGVATWSLDGLPNLQITFIELKTPRIEAFFYIIGKILKFKCLKRVRMTHLYICNTSYGNKKGRESSWQFDFRPQKIRNRLDPMRASGVQHTVGKLLTRTTTLLQTSS